MKSKFLAWAQCLYVAGITLGLIFILPFSWFPIQLGKFTLVAGALFLSSIFFVLSGAAVNLLKKRDAILIGLVALIPLSYLLSYSHSTNPGMSVSGLTFDGDTLAFAAMGFYTFVLGFGLFRSLKSSRALLFGVLGAAIIAGIFQFVVVLLGTAILPALFSDRSVNLVGKWNDFGLLVGLIPALGLFAWEEAGLSKRRRIMLAALMLAAFLLLAIVHFPLVWFFLLAWSIALTLWYFISRRITNKGALLPSVPWAPVGVALVSAVLLLWGSLVNTNLTSVFPVSSLEVRPSPASTLDIVKASHGSSVGRFLYGTGPQTFGDAWLLYKPTSVNQSVFWNLDFTIGFSTLTTALGSVGLLGAAALLIPLVLVLLTLVAVIRSKAMATRERFFALMLGFGGLYLWCALFLYVPSEPLVLAAFALSAACIGLVFGAQNEAAVGNFKRYAALVVSVVLVLALATEVSVVGKRLLSESYVNQGRAALNQGNTADASLAGASALRAEKTGNVYRLLTDIGLKKIQDITSVQNPTKAQVDEFTALAQQTILQGQEAVKVAPADYRSYVAFGRVYDLLASVSVPGAYQSAKPLYESAARMSPVNPQIPLLLARLEAAQGNLPATEENLSRALELKPDYTDAILFMVQLNVAKKDIPNAITAAQAAVGSAPGVPYIWFELGLLYYAQNDTANAIPVFEQAVKLQPDYANAKYFLGLSYVVQGRVGDAIQQFSDLLSTNPDNQEVKLILSNLQAGKAPFSGAEPPLSTQPQDRTNAPISQ